MKGLCSQSFASTLPTACWIMSRRRVLLAGNFSELLHSDFETGERHASRQTVFGCPHLESSRLIFCKQNCCVNRQKPIYDLNYRRTGNNGQELVRQLVAAGQRVRALLRSPAKATDLKGPNVELAVGDFDQPATLDAALRGMDKAFLRTPVAEHFVESQSAFIEAAQRAELKHLVKFSGMGADSGAKVELLRFHGETDNLLRNSGVPFTLEKPQNRMNKCSLGFGRNQGDA